MMLIVKGKMLIKDIAADASKEIVGSRRNPIAEMKDVIKHKHDCATHDSVDDTYHDKLHESLVSE